MADGKSDCAAATELGPEDLDRVRGGARPPFNEGGRRLYVGRTIALSGDGANSAGPQLGAASSS